MFTDVKNKTQKTSSICKVLSNKFGVGNSMFRVGAERPIKVDTVPFGIYKKDLLFQVGLYNENLIRNHDIELSKRLINANKKIYLVPSARCFYYARESYSGIVRNNFLNGMWNILTVYLTKHFNSLSMRHFIPLIFILSLIIPIILMLFIPIIGLLAVASLLVYLLTIIFISSKLSDADSSFIHILWTFLAIHFSYSFGSLVGLFRINYLFRNF